MLVNSRKLTPVTEAELLRVGKAELEMHNLEAPTILFDRESQAIYLKCPPGLYSMIINIIRQFKQGQEVGMFDVLKIWKKIKPILHDEKQKLNIEEI